MLGLFRLRDFFRDWDARYQVFWSPCIKLIWSTQIEVNVIIKRLSGPETIFPTAYEVQSWPWFIRGMKFFVTNSEQVFGKKKPQRREKIWSNRQECSGNLIHYPLWEFGEFPLYFFWGGAAHESPNFFLEILKRQEFFSNDGKTILYVISTECFCSNPDCSFWWNWGVSVWFCSSGNNQSQVILQCDLVNPPPVFFFFSVGTYVMSSQPLIFRCFSSPTKICWSLWKEQFQLFGKRLQENSTTRRWAAKKVGKSVMSLANEVSQRKIWEQEGEIFLTNKQHKFLQGPR